MDETRRSRITTKCGDHGATRVLTGDTLSKSHPAIEAVGALDELRAHTAWLRLRLIEKKTPDADASAEFLLWLLQAYFAIGSACSDPWNRLPKLHGRTVAPPDLERIEAELARLEARTPLPKTFVVSAQTPLAAQTDVVCTVARRFERTLVRLAETVPEFRDPTLFAFANRLSDYLYMLARSLDAR